MKKIVFLLLIVLCLPIGLMAQSDDDLYFVPSKEKEEPAPAKKQPMQRQATTNIYTTPGTTVVVQDRKGNTRDVDEYNRRYDARDNDFEMEDDTLYIREKDQPDLDGEWVNGEFNGTEDDYEYAQRLIRFRNPRFAVSISSPYYWDIVYGTNSWDWNVYTDGLYAYAFPTFSNSLWWDWRYNSYGSGWGWGWSSPYYGGYPGYWGGWYGGGYWGGHWGHHHHGWYPGGWNGGYWADRTYYNNRRSYSAGGNRVGLPNSSRRSSDSYVRGSQSSTSRRGNSLYDRSSSTSTSRRVVGERSSDRTSTTSRGEGTTSRRGSTSYTRPSSTRTTGSYDTDRRSSATSSGSSNRESTRSGNSSYSRGSSTMPSRSSSSESSSRRSYSTPSSSSRSYTPSSSGSSSRSSGSYSSGGGSTSRSSGGGGGGSSRRR